MSGITVSSRGITASRTLTDDERLQGSVLDVLDEGILVPRPARAALVHAARRAVRGLAGRSRGHRPRRRDRAPPGGGPGGPAGHPARRGRRRGDGDGSRRPAHALEPRREQLHGWTRDEATGRDLATLITPPDAADPGALRGTKSWNGEYTLRRRDGSTFPAALRLRTMVDAQGRAIGRTAVAVDLSERVAAERALVAARNYLRAVADSIGEGLFTLDSAGRLTYMNSAAEQLLGWSLAELHGEVFHDVSHFRHADGRPMPIEDCRILRARRDGETVRVETDVFVTREGRDLPVAYTAAPFETDDGVLGCVVVFEDISARKDREALLRQDAEKFGWIGRLQDALARDRFVLYSQPIIDVGTRRTVQRELLLRLREPDGTIVGPDAFLPVAEQSGLIGEIDRWVIAQGARLARSGQAVEINLSGRSMGDQRVLEHIERCLWTSGVDPRLMVFEITETAIVEDVDAARRFAERLRELGCRLALDDFGTGYGGFTYLKQLPVDYLKIDIEFVRDLTTDPASRHVVQAVVALARGFGLRATTSPGRNRSTRALRTHDRSTLRDGPERRAAATRAGPGADRSRPEHRRSRAGDRRRQPGRDRATPGRPGRRAQPHRPVRRDPLRGARAPPGGPRRPTGAQRRPPGPGRPGADGRRRPPDRARRAAARPHAAATEPALDPGGAQRGARGPPAGGGKARRQRPPAGAGGPQPRRLRRAARAPCTSASSSARRAGRYAPGG